MTLLGIIASSRSTGGLPVSGAALWLDAADATVFSFSSSTRVSEWRDKSGNNRNFTQSTGANQPNRNATQNGKDAVTFREAGTIYLITNATYDWSASAFTVLAVCRFNLGTFPALIGRTTTGSLQLGGGNNASQSERFISISRVGQATSDSNLSQSDSTTSQITYKSAGISSGSVTVQIYQDGTAASSTVTLSSLSAGSGAILGASVNANITDPFGNNGFICELIIYPSQLSDTDRGLVETYLSDKWGTP